MSYNTDKNIVFKEDFQSEESVERNGGTCTAVVFTDKDGAYFNGTSSKIDYGNTDRCKFNSTNKFSFRCVVKPTDLTNRTILTKWQAVSPLTDSEYAIRINSQNDVHFFVTNVSSDLGTMFGYTSNANFNIIDYVEMVFVYTGAGSTNADKLKIYKNGVLLSSTYNGTIPTSLSNSSANFTIGTFTGTITQYFKGYMKLIEAYNKALTAEEVKNLYNKNSQRDVRNGLILDIDARDGVIQDRCGNSLTMSGVSVKKDSGGNACYFDGSSYGINTNMIINENDGITINLWEKLTSTALKTSGDIGLFGTTTPSRVITIITAPISYADTLYLILGDFLTLDTNINLVNWSMCTFLFLSNGTVNVYVNGLYVGQKLNQLFSGNLYFGSYGTTVRRMLGYQNQQRIYNRVLSVEEISQLYSYQKKNYE